MNNNINDELIDVIWDIRNRIKAVMRHPETNMWARTSLKDAQWALLLAAANQERDCEDDA